MLPVVAALIISSGSLFVKMDERLIVKGSAGQQPAPFVVVEKPVSANATGCPMPNPDRCPKTSITCLVAIHPLASDQDT